MPTKLFLISLYLTKYHFFFFFNFWFKVQYVYNFVKIMQQYAEICKTKFHHKIQTIMFREDSKVIKNPKK